MTWSGVNSSSSYSAVKLISDISVFSAKVCVQVFYSIAPFIIKQILQSVLFLSLLLVLKYNSNLLTGLLPLLYALRIKATAKYVNVNNSQMMNADSLVHRWLRSVITEYCVDGSAYIFKNKM